MSCRHVALFTHPVIPACVGLTNETRPPCRVFYCLEFTCSQDSPWEGLDVDSRTVRRTESTPAARAPLLQPCVGVARDRNSEIDAKGRRRWDGLWPTARKDERTYSGPLHSQGLFRFRLPTPIAPSWECSGRRIYQSPQGGGNPDAKHA